MGKIKLILLFFGIVGGGLALFFVLKKLFGKKTATPTTAQANKPTGTDLTGSTSNPSGSTSNPPSGSTIALSAVSSAGKIELTWNRPTSPATSFKVMRSVNSSGPFTRLSTVSGTYYPDTSGIAGTLYYYRVIAVNGTVETLTSTTASATSIASAGSQAPSAVTNVTANYSNGMVTLNWSIPTAGGVATGYKVMRSATNQPNSFVQIATITGTSFANVVSVLVNTTFYYKIVATNQGGDGLDTGSVAVVVLPTAGPGSPNPATGLTAEFNDGAIFLQWSAPTAGAVVGGYKVRRREESEAFGEELEITTELYFQDNNPPSATGLYYSVIAYNGSGEAYPEQTYIAT